MVYEVEPMPPPPPPTPQVTSAAAETNPLRCAIWGVDLRPQNIFMKTILNLFPKMQ